jgi:hypothetical protein
MLQDVGQVLEREAEKGDSSRQHTRGMLKPLSLRTVGLRGDWPGHEDISAHIHTHGVTFWQHFASIDARK